MDKHNKRRSSKNRRGGAGVVLWQHSRGRLTFADSVCLPLYPCPDAAHAEAAGAAAAVQPPAKHYPLLKPNRIIIKGDNRAVIDFITHTGKYRRTDLQHALQEAHHLLAFRLPPCTWCYAPREFNKCAGFLAGPRPRSGAPLLLWPVRPCSWPFLLSPPSLSCYRFLPVTTPFSLPHSHVLYLPGAFLLLGVPPPPSFPDILSYSPHLALPTHALPLTISGILLPTLPCSNSHCLSALRRRWPWPPLPTPAGSCFPRDLRLLLFGQSHVEVDLVSAHYQLYQCAAATLLSVHLPRFAAEGARTTDKWVPDILMPKLELHLETFMHKKHRTSSSKDDLDMIADFLGKRDDST